MNDETTALKEANTLKEYSIRVILETPSATGIQGIILNKVAKQVRKDISKQILSSNKKNATVTEKGNLLLIDFEGTFEDVIRLQEGAKNQDAKRLQQLGIRYSFSAQPKDSSALIEGSNYENVTN